MYIVNTIYNRPSEDVVYFVDSLPEFKGAFVEFTQKMQSLLLFLNSYDEGPLKHVTTSIYASKEDFEKFMVEFVKEFPTFMDDKKTYCELHNIELSQEFEED